MVYFNMPANLPPEYYNAELNFRKATTVQEKISALEYLISTVPKHKGTDKLRAELRRKLSKLRDDSVKKKKSGRGDLYTVEKQGAAQIALVGYANSGKSSLLASLTNAKPVIADFPMSTVLPLSGMMRFEDIQFQIIDLPPVGNESTDGWVSGILRTATMMILVIDASDAPDLQVELLFDQINSWGIPLADREESAAQDGPFRPKPVIVVLNKEDIPGSSEDLNSIKRKYRDRFPVVGFSSILQTGIEELRKTVFEHSGIIRVYSKEPGKMPDRDAPFTVTAGSTVLDLARIIHKDFVVSLKYACIWGSGKFDGQRVQKDYALQDRDIVEYHIK